MEKPPDITLLLNEWADGSSLALEQLSPLVYEQLRKFAYRAFSREAGFHTLQPTALVNEVFIKLVDADVPWQNRAHFYALAARMMRRLLINYANEQNALKRGANFTRVLLDQEQLSSDAPGTTHTDLLALNEGLEQLATTDMRKVELIELQYFAGLTFREMEEVTGLSSSTIDRELRFARAWLKKFLIGS
ncbi:MAG: ECF-type sigma factor [Halieaceae bacterium]|jgi:RNA polymerase sigma factor (TIGR02999 family)|nr:ECF-type sigma factor [Halieaceae bacterium]